MTKNSCVNGLANDVEGQLESKKDALVKQASEQIDKAAKTAKDKVDEVGKMGEDQATKVLDAVKAQADTVDKKLGELGGQIDALQHQPFGEPFVEGHGLDVGEGRHPQHAGLPPDALHCSQIIIKEGCIATIL